MTINDQAMNCQECGFEPADCTCTLRERDTLWELGERITRTGARLVTIRRVRSRWVATVDGYSCSAPTFARAIGEALSLAACASSASRTHEDQR